MYRSDRDTAKWFDSDIMSKPMINDRMISKDIGPGKYADGNDKQTAKTAISWNLGKVPFRSGHERFKTDYRLYFKPGPGHYNNETGVGNSGSLSVDGIGQVSPKNMSPRAAEQYQNKLRSSNFKSKAPKVSIYKDEEKRLRQLHGPKKNLKYQIKLNDEILDKNKRSLSMGGAAAKLVLGPNFAIEQQIVPPHEAERNKDLFGLQKLNKMGPQDYDPNIQGKKAPQVVLKAQTAADVSGSVKKKMENYLGNIFDQGAVDRAKKAGTTSPSNTEPTTLETMQPFAIDKRDMCYKSQIRRDPLKPNKEQALSPGPAVYNPAKPSKELLQGRNYAQFGTNAARDNLIQRNVANSPFTNPTSLKGPSPDKYQPNEHSSKQKDTILQQVGSSFGSPEQKMSNSFYSPVLRDFMDQVPKEQKINPGPGSYDTQIQDKLKVLNYQLSTRYHLKPFGAGAVRFGYQQPQVKNQRQTIDFNQMISVKDQEVMQKRDAFLYTINQHKKLAQTHQNAVFSSTKGRFEQGLVGEGFTGDVMAPTASAPYQTAPQEQMNKTGRAKFEHSDQNMTQSTFGLSFQKGGQNSQGFSADRMHKTFLNQQSSGVAKQFLRENPGYGFASTAQRFSYMKEMQKMGEVPGPGSYNGQDLSTVAGSAVQKAVGVPAGGISKQGLNTISSAGTGVFFRQQSTNNTNMSPQPMEGSPSQGIHGSPINEARKKNFTTVGSSMFENSTSRDDFRHYVPKNTNNTIHLKNLGPGSYFKSKSPFLKRSFNASLPPSKFY